MNPFQDEYFSDRVKNLIKQIPPGRVATYGQIAFLAGFPSSTRQVVWILHSCSKKDNLPWHRVINRKGTISLKPNAGFEIQKKLLEREGVIFNDRNQIDLNRFLWEPEETDFFQKK
jgi:methylated-DNA-protein-cysteine methyltransferase-like protein